MLMPVRPYIFVRSDTPPAFLRWALHCSRATRGLPDAAAPRVVRPPLGDGFRIAWWWT